MNRSALRGADAELSVACRDRYTIAAPSLKLCSRKMTGVFRLAVALFAVLAASEGAVSQTYPVRPIRFLVGSPPGSGNDLVSRLLAQKLAAWWERWSPIRW